MVLIIGLALSHLASMAMYTTDLSNTLISADGRHIADRIAAIDRVIRKTSPDEREMMATRISDDTLKVSITPHNPAGEMTNPGTRQARLLTILKTHLDPVQGRRIYLRVLGKKPVRTAENRNETAETVLVSLSLPEGKWLNFTIPLQSPARFLTLRFGLSMLVMLLAIVIFSAMVVNHLTRPLAEFAQAAKRLGVDVNAPPLPERGPAEIRKATQAFNQMQNRIRRFVEDRTQMLAAISHDLGTPIARMRLRAEFVDDEDQQKKMLADLDDMERMVSSALSFARDDAIREPVEKVDLRTLLQRVCDDLSDTGYAVTLDIDDAVLAYYCHPSALRRALGNLIENAARYGGTARVFIKRETERIFIVIEDTGPGIPPGRQEDVFKPFFRLETSRNRETGGTGLGMTVARTIIHAHGGDIRLENRKEGGLTVEVRLPVVSS